MSILNEQEISAVLEAMRGEEKPLQEHCAEEYKRFQYKEPNERCPCCQAEEEMGGKNLVDFDGASIELMVDGVFLYAYCNCGWHVVAEIKYCPMCGREL